MFSMVRIFPQNFLILNLNYNILQLALDMSNIYIYILWFIFLEKK